MKNEILQEINEAKKAYYAPMHSAEHILNQTMVQMFNCGRSVSNHIERKKSKCDYNFDRPLSNDEVAEIEERVNLVIMQNLTVTEDFVNRSEAAGLDLSKLPKNARQMLRIVKIGNYDTCPCIGEHVRNTSEIGIFKIISTDFDNGILRIRYKLIR